ncbi:MAG: hypothetical protein C7B43_06100 [Sulfobacillus benefaciens]|uniref:Uncharacterized protein n=1 Tax=Sulfobacillus benefaciens TaxID=453960 RepID=A0A2T2X7K2_9FIRM|nr:MAG: hypothetical protein C7B43_06100 [Sulfobacillus benefaciens]HBQ94102.1 hypothetical protein [Sulfobacillus sp.]
MGIKLWGLKSFPGDIGPPRRDSPILLALNEGMVARKDTWGRRRNIVSGKGVDLLCRDFSGARGGERLALALVLKEHLDIWEEGLEYRLFISRAEPLFKWKPRGRLSPGDKSQDGKLRA